MKEESFFIKNKSLIIALIYLFATFIYFLFIKVDESAKMIFFGIVTICITFVLYDVIQINKLKGFVIWFLIGLFHITFYFFKIEVLEIPDKYILLLLFPLVVIIRLLIFISNFLQQRDFGIVGALGMSGPDEAKSISFTDLIINIGFYAIIYLFFYYFN